MSLSTLLGMTLVSFGLVALGCESGKECFDLGMKTQGEGKLEEATALYKKGCEKKFAESCNKYGFLIAALKNDAKESAKYFEMSCEMGYGGGCNNIADQAKRSGDRRKAKKYYDLGCKKGYQRSCVDGELLKMGVD